MGDTRQMMNVEKFCEPEVVFLFHHVTIVTIVTTVTTVTTAKAVTSVKLSQQSRL